MGPWNPEGALGNKGVKIFDIHGGFGPLPRAPFLKNLLPPGFLGPGLSNPPGRRAGSACGVSPKKSSGRGPEIPSAIFFSGLDIPRG